MYDVDAALEQVAEAEGLTDYGHPSFRDGLDVMAANLGSARLNAIGEAAFDSTVRQSLQNRLRVTEWHRAQPRRGRPGRRRCRSSSWGSPAPAPRRSATCSPPTRPTARCAGWEAHDSVPPPTEAGYWTDPRYLAAKEGGNMLDLINPRFKAIHHDEPEDAVECAIPLGQHFASIALDSMFNIDGYGDWLYAADLTHAYDYHRQVLQVLGSEYGGPWQLKSPVHAYAMETVAAAYPDAVFVQTHRDPAKCIASTLSLNECLSGTFTDADFHDRSPGCGPTG